MHTPERVKLFDSYVESVDSALCHPAVIRRLGATASILSDINRRLYLPNFRDDTVQIPTVYEHQDSVALLPLLARDERVIVGATFDIPSAADTQRMVEALAAHFPALLQEQVAEMVTDDVKRYSGTWSVEAGDVTAGVNKKIDGGVAFGELEVAGSFLGVARSTFRGKGIYKSRGLLFMHHKYSEATSAYVAGTIVHELVHAKNYLNSDHVYTIGEAAEDELEAYHAGYCVNTALWKDMTQVERESEQFSKTMEAFRMRHTTKEMPYTPTPALLKLMLRYGAVNTRYAQSTPKAS